MFEELIRESARSSEQDFRLAILNSLLKTPHRKLEPFIALFKHVHERDPLFFARLAAWYFDNGAVHDLRQLFIAYLVTSKFSEDDRDTGIAMLQKLPPYQVERVLYLIKGHEEGDKFVNGIAASIPRSLRTAIEEYLRERERDCKAFDNAVLHARKSLKTLYASLRIKPGDYAQRVLFDNNPPADSRLFVLKQLAKERDPAEQARIIVENKLPYRVAISGLKHVTPSVLAALLSIMTPQEVINNLNSLKRRGAMDNKDLRKLIETKLEQGKSDKRVSALKTREAMKAANLDSEMTARVASVGDRQIKAKAKIIRPTALHIDKSGSMQIAIDVGMQIASVIAPICDSDLFVYAFDSLAYPLIAKGPELSDWERAFKGINAGGSTACGAALEVMRKRKQFVEQIIMVTDQGENVSPMLVPTLKKYAEELGTMPDLIIVNVGQHSRDLELKLEKENLTCDTFTFNGDYYSLPGLLPLLAGGTRMDLLLDIMSYPLPERKPKALTTTSAS